MLHPKSYSKMKFKGTAFSGKEVNKKQKICIYIFLSYGNDIIE